MWALHRRAAVAERAAAARRAAARPARPAPPPLLDEDAAAIFSVLDHHQVDYVVIGGLAAAIWGSDLPRTTDADITPDAGAANLDRLAGALTQLDARLRSSSDPAGVAVRWDGRSWAD